MVEAAAEVQVVGGRPIIHSRTLRILGQMLLRLATPLAAVVEAAAAEVVVVEAEALTQVETPLAGTRISSVRRS